MIDTAVGFVYLIENLDTGMLYVGKKLFTKSKHYQKNNKKRRKRIESDWIEYCGSNDLLKQQAAAGANLRKTILHLCKSKGMMSYLEVKEIVDRGALLDDKYYNSFLGCKIHRRHVK